jgi:hypothetical protein
MDVCCSKLTQVTRASLQHLIKLLVKDFVSFQASGFMVLFLSKQRHILEIGTWVFFPEHAHLGSTWMVSSKCEGSEIFS